MARWAAHIAVHNGQMLATIQCISHGVWPYRCAFWLRKDAGSTLEAAATAKAYSCAMDSPKTSAHRGAARQTPVAMAKLEQTCPTSEEMQSSPYNSHNDAKHQLSVTPLPCKSAPRIASPFWVHFYILPFKIFPCHVDCFWRTNVPCDSLMFM